MTTFVGTQSDFIEALTELVELEWDALEAYNEAIKRLGNEAFKRKFQEFKQDHERHISLLNPIIVQHGGQIVEGPSAKQWLTKGKVVLANMMGDNAILVAMLTNEEDTNTAYDRMTHHKEKWPDSAEILNKNFEDEKRHKAWIKENIEK